VRDLTGRCENPAGQSANLNAEDSFCQAVMVDCSAPCLVALQHAGRLLSGLSRDCLLPKTQCKLVTRCSTFQAPRNDGRSPSLDDHSSPFYKRNLYEAKELVESLRESFSIHAGMHFSVLYYNYNKTWGHGPLGNT